MRPRKILNMSKYILKQRGEKDEELLARQAFQSGMKLYGYCHGLFGRDSYGIKTIVSINGDIITVEEEGSYNSSQMRDPFSWVDLLKSSNDACEDEDYVTD